MTYFLVQVIYLVVQNRYFELILASGFLVLFIHLRYHISVFELVIRNEVVFSLNHFSQLCQVLCLNKNDYEAYQEYTP